MGVDGVGNIASDRSQQLRAMVVGLAAVIILIAAAAACGGDGVDGSPTAAESAAAETTTPAPTATPLPTSTPFVIATSTSLPAATPTPTATPVPLKAPTPSAILLEGAFTNHSRVTTVGIDEVFFGMLAAEAAEAASTTWVGDPSSSSTCYQVVPSDGPDGITLWIVDGRVERVDIEHRDIRTPSELGIGNTSAELKSQLGGRLTTEPGEGDEIQAVFTPSDAGDADFRIIFDLADDQVARYRSGRVGVVERAFSDC